MRKGRLKTNVLRRLRMHNGTVRLSPRTAVLLPCLVALWAIDAQAQRSCRPTRGHYQYAAYAYLTNPADSAWHDALGITLRSPRDLRPLSDSGDAALCARIVSMLAPRHTLGFRIGSHVIAVPEGTGDLPRVRSEPMFFLLDSLGRKVDQEGVRARSLTVPEPDHYADPAVILVRESDLGDLR